MPKEQHWVNGQPVPQKNVLPIWAIRRRSSDEIAYVSVHPTEGWFMDYVAFIEREEWIRVDDITHFRSLTQNESAHFVDSLLKIMGMK